MLANTLYIFDEFMSRHIRCNCLCSINRRAFLMCNASKYRYMYIRDTHMLLHVFGSRDYHKSIIFYLSETQTSESQYASIQISHVIQIYAAWPCQYPSAVPAHLYPLQADEMVVCSMEVPVSRCKFYFIRCHYV